MENITLAQQSSWASGISASLDDTITSNGSVVGWLQTNLGLLNAYLHTEFVVNADEEIETHMLPAHSGLYNEMYYCHWLKKKSRSLLNNADYDWIEMRGEKQGSVKIVSKNERAKTINSMSKDCDINLKAIIKDLRGGGFLTPRSISFNERFSTPNDIKCRDYYRWSEFNPVADLPDNILLLNGTPIYFTQP